MVRWTSVLLVLVLTTASFAATPVVFTLSPIMLSNGWQVTGTITTDGSTGNLAPASILDWNLKIIQITDMLWTPKNSNDQNISGVSTDGKKIYVSTSPDGYSDGGTLYVSTPTGLGQIPTNAIIADFTQLSVNLGYGTGGIAGWQSELGGLNYVALNQRDGTRYAAASLVAGQLTPRVFSINVPILATDPLLMTMFGTLTTDGTIGALLPRNIVDWKITARTQQVSLMTKANSRVLALIGVSADGTSLKVAHAGGQFQIGVPGRRPTFVSIADFTNPDYPDGVANYYVGSYGTMGEKFPLVSPSAQFYVGARRK